MDVTNKIIQNKTGFSIADLTDNIVNRKYSLHLLKMEKRSNQSFQLKNSIATLIIIEGEVKITNQVQNFERTFKLEEGLHLMEGTNLEISSQSGAKLLIASTSPFPLQLCDTINNKFEVEELSSYHVDKPWGWEKWYTKNVDETTEYALKMIFMNEGNQSSLQSHKDKSETNYVIFGEANVIYGLDAPQDRSSVIALDQLKEKIHCSFEGWSNKVNELHRVIAKKTYKAIEVSTTELDDVIRWQDDALRPDGKIKEEHKSN